MTTKTTAKKTAATPEAKKPREQAAPSETHLAYKLDSQTPLHDDVDRLIVDVVPFGHRQADEMTAYRWAQGRGYFVTTVPAGTSLVEHLKFEGLL